LCERESEEAESDLELPLEPELESERPRRECGALAEELRLRFSGFAMAAGGGRRLSSAAFARFAPVAAASFLAS
jgi:hypothetical protein